jgi:hypothetical protein
MAMHFEELVDHLFVADVDCNLAKVLVSFKFLSLLSGSAVMELKVELTIFVLVIVGFTTYVLSLVVTG